MGRQLEALGSSEWIENRFFQELRGKPRLDALGNQQLFKQLAEGNPDARGKIAEGNLALVVRFARRSKGNGVPFLDLIQTGILALFKAIDDFDPKRGSFSTLAFRRIQVAMTDELAQSSQPVNLPTDKNRVQQAEPDGKKFRTGNRWVGRGRHDAIKMASKPFLSLNQPALEYGYLLEEMVADPSAIDPEAYVVKQLTYEAMGRVIGPVLTEREIDVFNSHYGFPGGLPQTYEEIGSRLGVTPQRAEQINKKALEKLRDPAVLAQLKHQAN